MKAKGTKTLTKTEEYPLLYEPNATTIPKRMKGNKKMIRLEKPSFFT